MSKIRIGIVGSGGMAAHHAERFSAIDAVEPAAIASRNPDTGRRLAQKHQMEFMPDWQALVQRDDLDGIVICTHNDSHGAIAIAALECDKHVFTEYPLARSISEGERAVALARTRRRALRISHSETVSNLHQAIKQCTQTLGDLLLTSFLRLTPGRGGRPEILFNLPVSGPPAHFFIYHIYPIIDLFGGVGWVEAGAVYGALTEQGRYDRFANTVNVGFRRGGIGQWTWAGGIEIHNATQESRYVLTNGTIANRDGRWYSSTKSAETEISPSDSPTISLQEQWTAEIAAADLRPADQNAETALEAIRVSLSAEQSVQENRRVIVA